MTTISRVCLQLLIQVMGALLLCGVGLATPETFPHFRHVDPLAAMPNEKPAGVITLLTDDDFAPFSYKDAKGAIIGIAVDMALQACAEVKLSCQLKPMGFADLMPALARGEGDVIISGLRPTTALMEKTRMTRPYFFSFGRFLMRVGMPFETPDIRSLAGRRIGFVKGTAHQAFLEKYYERSALTPFATEAELFESLRTGKLDAVFTDSLRAGFWLHGTASRNCCVALGGGFVEDATITRGLAFFTGQNRELLREYFDFALDRLDEKGEAAKIFELLYIAYSTQSNANP